MFCPTISAISLILCEERKMNKQFMVKYRTKQGGSSTVTTQVSANSSNEAKAKVKQQHSGCTIVSCTEKCCWTIPLRRLMSTPVPNEDGGK